MKREGIFPFIGAGCWDTWPFSHTLESFVRTPLPGRSRRVCGADTWREKKPWLDEKVVERNDKCGTWQLYILQVSVFTNPGLDCTLHFSHLFTWNWSFVGGAALPLQLDLY